jgi:hypothetical protein
LPHLALHDLNNTSEKNICKLKHQKNKFGSYETGNEEGVRNWASPAF